MARAKSVSMADLDALREKIDDLPVGETAERIQSAGFVDEKATSKTLEECVWLFTILARDAAQLAVQLTATRDLFRQREQIQEKYQKA